MAQLLDDELPFATRRHLSAYIERYGWSIGAHSYGCPTVLEEQYSSLTIGRFCSIASGTILVLGNHRTSLVSTYPFRTLFGYWPGAEHGVPDHEGRDIEIGSDVWLGVGATILSGARIGHGAIVGANAVVSGSVEPYSIVVGNPAKPIRKRFSEEVIERLLRIAWWDWPDAQVRKAVPLMSKGDIAAFLDRYDPAVDRSRKRPARGAVKNSTAEVALRAASIPAAGERLSPAPRKRRRAAP